MRNSIFKIIRFVYSRMPIPTPMPQEDKKTFMGRCMADDKMVIEYPETDQRTAICNTSWRNEKFQQAKKKKS